MDVDGATIRAGEDGLRQSSSICLARNSQAPGRARRALAQLLAGDERSEAVALATSELVTNVVRHAEAAQAIDVRLDRRRDSMRVSVSNADAGGPFEVPAAQADGPGGWGLGIVAAVSRAWGVEHGRGRTAVWFEV